MGRYVSQTACFSVPICVLSPVKNKNGEQEGTFWASEQPNAADEGKNRRHNKWRIILLSINNKSRYLPIHKIIRLLQIERCLA